MSLKMRIIAVFDSLLKWDGITNWQSCLATIACREADFLFAVAFV